MTEQIDMSDAYATFVTIIFVTKLKLIQFFSVCFPSVLLNEKKSIHKFCYENFDFVFCYKLLNKNSFRLRTKLN